MFITFVQYLLRCFHSGKFLDMFPLLLSSTRELLIYQEISICCVSSRLWGPIKKLLSRKFKLLVVTNPQETTRFYAIYWKLLDFIPKWSEMGLSKNSKSLAY